MNEAETRAELIDPALHAAGWGVVEASRTRREGVAVSPNWQQDHLSTFKATTGRVTVTDPPARLIPRLWAGTTGLGNHLPDQSQNRSTLIGLAADSSVPTPAVCWSILAWGGMHGRHRDALHGQSDRDWLHLAESIRSGKHIRSSAYDAFSALRRENRLSGMGPAYFTKLIFFLMPRRSLHPIGYIMDQWVACSINLLAGREIVLTDATFQWAMVRKQRKLKSAFMVSDLNDGTAYEDYCVHIESLAQEIGKAPDIAEWLMMSAGRGLGEWRSHVIRHRQPPHE